MNVHADIDAVHAQDLSEVAMDWLQHRLTSLVPLAAVMAMVLLIFPTMGFSSTTSSTFNVTATIVASCVVSASNVAFGSYVGAQLDATGSVVVTCTNLAPYTVELDVGTGAGATAADRKMTGPLSQTLSYSLYQDSSRTLPWGPLASALAVAGTGTGSAQTLVVYGRMPASQTPGAGVYSDTITVTVTY